MYCSRVVKTSTTKHAASQLLRNYSNPSTLRVCLTTQKKHIARNFSTFSSHLNPIEFPSSKDASGTLITETAWPHPVYTEKQMRENIRVAHREARNWSDYIALGLVRFLRWGTDIATGFKHNVPNPNLHPGDDNSVSGTMVGKQAKYAMTEKKWLIRFIFLESVAGVPGMVAGMLRHLHSIRRLKRDNGWIETLLEEAYNERMHLLTFLKLQEPGWFMKVMILGAQGVFFNTLFLSYLISPRTCHRFVGYLEEEAVHTYSLAIQAIELGLLPEWSNLEAPEMAVKYWKMPEGKRSMHDLLLYIRADEAKHREVNHTLSNLQQETDPNPFISKYIDPTKPYPGKGIEHLRPTGWEREEVVKG